MLLVAAILFLILLGLFLWISANWTFYSLLFYPSRYHIWSSKLAHKTLLLEDKISAWHFANHPGKPTVLFCHGNAGNISHRQYIVDLCHRNKLNLLVFDYQGFGRSRGYATQEGVCQDGLLAYDYLAERVDPKSIYIWGESLGGAVATYVASQRPCAALILMATFSSLGDIPKHSGSGPLYSWLGTYMDFMGSGLPSKQRIRDVQCPIVILHSPTDDLIPYQNALTLYEAISHDCRLFIPISGGHVTPKLTTEQLERMFAFCKMKCDACPRSMTSWSSSSR